MNLNISESKQINLQDVKRHISIIGSSGCGKTVTGKVCLEELALHGIPCIAIDMQGDICSLQSKKLSKRANVKIFTPLSDKGIYLSLKNPFDYLDIRERMESLNLISATLTKLAGYTRNSDLIKNFLFSILEKGDIKSLDTLAKRVSNMDDTSLLTKRQLTDLSKRLNSLLVGMNRYIFSKGTPFSVDNMIKVTNGKPSINVIYLNTISDDKLRDFFLTQICAELYHWIKKHPSETLQICFYIDEVSGLVPPYPKNPPTKEYIKLLFKQGRKFGCGCILATQNPTDVDYKVLAQSNTWFIGTIRTKQDKEWVKHLFKHSGQHSEVDAVLSQLPTLKPGWFFYSHEDDVIREPVKIRWLYSKHYVVQEDEITRIMKKQISVDSTLSGFCNGCGSKIPNEDMFCSECGRKNKFYKGLSETQIRDAVGVKNGL